MSYGDALHLEAEWFREEVVGFPPLLAETADKSGPFQVVEPYVRRIDQRPQQLFICRDPYLERRMDRGGAWNQAEHGVAAMIVWAKAQNASLAHEEQQRLDEAVERVLTRVRGLPHDHSHGGLFFSAGDGEIRVDYPDPRTLLDVADAPGSLGNAYVVVVRYRVVEAVTAG